MTSNLGSSYIQEQFSKITPSNRDTILEETKEKLLEMLKKSIRPEFLNRIDETIMFTPLNEKEIEQIVRLQTAAVAMLLNENGMKLEVSDTAITFIAQTGFDSEFGARPIKRAIQRLLLNDLSKQLLAGTIDKNAPIKVDAINGELVFTNH
jgi:ATP-dependent Clp protease ATP-binding subunit ClpB